MQHVRRHKPAGADLQAVGLRDVGDAVIALVPALETADDVRLGRAGHQTEEGVGETRAQVVVLRREVVGFRLALLPHQLGELVVLMQVVRQRPEVVEELAVDRPAPVLLPDLRADDRRAQFGHHIAQQHALVLEDHIAQALIRQTPLVRRLGGRAEPALVDTAAVKPECVEVIRVQLQPASGITERARHPVRRQPQHAAARVQRGVRHRARLSSTHGLQLFHRIDSHVEPLSFRIGYDTLFT